MANPGSGRLQCLTVSSQGELDEARDAFNKDPSIAHELNDKRGIGIMLNSLGDVAWLQNNLDTAVI